MKCKSLVLLGSLLAAFAVTSLATAQEDQSQIVVKKDAATAIVARVSEAAYIREMAVNGRETKDPYLLIEAAQLAISSAKIPSLKSQVKTPGQAPEKKIDVEPAALLKEAAQMAGDQADREALTLAAEVARNKVTGLGNDALADEISKTNVARGMVHGGSLHGEDCLDSGKVIYYEAKFRGHEEAEVIVAASPNPIMLGLGDQKTGDVATYDNVTEQTVTWYMERGGTVRIVIGAAYGATCFAIRIP